MNTLLEKILEECYQYTGQGRVANYIPELAKANPDKLGIYIISEKNEIAYAGDYQESFTMQSVIKPMILLLALIDSGIDRVRDLVGVEATGKPFDTFNYSDQALRGEHINPMVNAGAIALCTLIKGNSYEEKFGRLLNLTQKMSGNPSLEVEKVTV